MGAATESMQDGDDPQNPLQERIAFELAVINCPETKVDNFGSYLTMPFHAAN